MLDGVDMNEPIDNLLPYQPSPDALAEVRVETNNYSAEFGNVAGAVIGSTIKSGTNEFHGNAFEYWRDSSMAANSWDNNRADATKAELSAAHLRRHDRRADHQEQVFFFGDYQTFIRDRPCELVTTVAPEAWRRGDFSVCRRESDQRSGYRPAFPREHHDPTAGSAQSPERCSPTRSLSASKPPG